MKLKVFNTEKFEREKRRYIIFACVFILIIAVSIYYKNLVWCILMFLLLWAYIYYSIINIHEIDIQITENWVIIEKIVPRNELLWFCIELDKKSNEIKNIVFVFRKWHSIHTIADKEENLKKFVQELSNHTQMLWDYPQTFREKFSRKIKL